MFIDNKYKKTYSRIIDKALTENRVGDQFESHHIVPISIFGGKRNRFKNLGRTVNLTYKEHFICHWLLTKFTSGKDRQRMMICLTFMTAKGKRTSLEHRVAREAARNARIGISKDPDLRMKISMSLKGQKKTNATKLKMSASRMGKKRSDEFRRNLSAALTGKKRGRYKKNAT